MRHSARARALVASACAALLIGAPATALATANPVHVDPKSPVAKEYAIPLATARGAAPESGQTGALFGSGITPATHTTAAPSGAAAGSAAGSSSAVEHPPAATSTPPAATSTPPAATSTPPAATKTAAASTTVTTHTTPAATAAPQPPPASTVTGTDTIITVTLTDTAQTTTATAADPQPGAAGAARPGATVQAAPAAYKVLRPGTGSGLAWMVLAAVLVIALGSAGGFLLSRRR